MSRPYKRSRVSHFRYALEEVKFIRSLPDLGRFWEKMAYLLPRITGTLDRPTNVPPSLQIEPTNYCNVRCVCCSTSSSSRARGFMPLDLFQRIIAEAARVGVKRIHLYLHGEPTLHPQIVEMIQCIKRNGLAFTLTTNGMAWDRSKMEALLLAGVTSADYITFSVLGHSKAVHESVMKGAKHDRVLGNIQELINLRQGRRLNGPIIEVVFYALPANEAEEAQFVAYWRGKVDHVRLGGRISNAFASHAHAAERPAVRKQTCTNLWERMTILWNGEVSLCSGDVDGDWVLGNLNTQSIEQVWNSDKLLSIKTIHREKRFEALPFCSQCDM